MSDSIKIFSDKTEESRFCSLICTKNVPIFSQCETLVGLVNRLIPYNFTMNENQSNSSTPQAIASEGHKLSMESIIEKVRDSRNDLIKELLRDGKIQSYFMTTYNKSISPVKIEFIRRELKSLAMTPVDLIHYAALIKEIRKVNDFEIADLDRKIFYDELEVIFRRYNY